MITRFPTVKDIKRQEEKSNEQTQTNKLNYRVLSTGSKGNAVRIENIMIDCGIPFAKMKKDLYQCDALLITHCHTDHLKRSTYNRIRKEFPNIKTFANAEVAQLVPVDKVIGEKPFRIPKSNAVVLPLYGSHDVLVSYFYIKINGLLLMYATDTNAVQNPTGEKVDFTFLEANYDEKKLKAIAHQYERKGYDPVMNAERHLSKQKCKAFYYLNRKDRNSPLIELHMSERFY